MGVEGRVLENAGEQAGRGDWLRPARPAGEGGAEPVQTCDELRRVALEEMARGRRRLGELTPAQERALESLLVSVADNISDLVSAVAFRTPPRERVEEACAPPPAGVGALRPARA